MNLRSIVLSLICLSSSLYAANDQQLQRDVERLQKQTQQLQAQINTLQNKLVVQNKKAASQRPHARSQQVAKKQPTSHKTRNVGLHYHTSPITVHAPEEDPELIAFFPTALVADDHVITYIAGTPVVASPYLGDRPAFDGSDYIVNISSINRDIRLMQQRRRLFEAYRNMGYPTPKKPIISISGKSEPIGMVNSRYMGATSADLTLGSSELDVSAALNENVQAFISVAYDESPPEIGPRINNSAFNLNLGFVNIGNLDKTPIYFTAGQLFVPFGRYSSAMISAPLTMNIARTKTRPFILGYKSQEATGPFLATYIYRSDTHYGRSGVGGVNLGYTLGHENLRGELGVSYIGSMADAAGMQNTSANIGTFAGFGSAFHGSEIVRKTQAMDVYGNIAYDRFNFAAEWVGAIEAFRDQDLSYNGMGAKPQAIQTEIGMTFKTFNKPASVGVGYQWSKEALALNVPKQRIVGVFNISIWKDTVESLEYRHDFDYSASDYANGAAPFNGSNANTVGTGRGADTVSAQIGVYF